MPQVGLRDIIWSKEEFFPCQIPDRFTGQYPLIAVVSDSSCYSVEGDDWSQYQVICILGSTEKRVVMESEWVSTELPVPFPIQISVQLGREYNEPMRLGDVIKHYHNRLPLTVRFDSNYEVRAGDDDGEVIHNLVLTKITEKKSRPCLACVTINEIDTCCNSFFTFPCDTSFKMKIGIKLRFGRKEEWTNLVRHLSCNPGEILSEGGRHKLMTVTLQNIYEGLKLDVKPEGMEYVEYVSLDTNLSKHSSLPRPPTYTTLDRHQSEATTSKVKRKARSQSVLHTSTSSTCPPPLPPRKHKSFTTKNS